MFDTKEDLTVFAVCFLTTLFAFFGRSTRIDAITRVYPTSPRVPGIVFGAVWGILFPLRDYGLYCVVMDGVGKNSAWITVYIVQSILLLLWPSIYASLQFEVALADLSVAWGLGVFLLISARTDGLKIPFWSQVALVIWLAFAGYLNNQYIAPASEIRAVEKCRQEKRDREAMACKNEICKKLPA